MQGKKKEKEEGKKKGGKGEHSNGIQVENQWVVESWRAPLDADVTGTSACADVRARMGLPNGSGVLGTSDF